MLAYSCFIVMWLFSSILVPGELFLIHFQKVCANRKFCLRPKIPLRFPVALVMVVPGAVMLDL